MSTVEDFRRKFVNGADGSDPDAAVRCPQCGKDSCAGDCPCRRCGKKSCPGECPCSHVLDTNAVCTRCGLAFGLDVDGLHDATLAAARGQEIEKAGIRWCVDGIVPAYGMLGMLVAYAKVGKTTLGHALGAAVSKGEEFLGRETTKTRVLYIAAEDPPEYTDFLARHLKTEPGAMTFYERAVILDDDGLARICASVAAGKYGLVLIASWQAVVRGLIRDENDNTGAVVVVERVKTATRATKVPWLIDAHAGRSEDQDDDADPTRALRGASSAAGAADYILSLRYADGAFGHKRRLSGRGRFVTLAPQTITYDIEAGRYEALGATKSAALETTWRLIETMGALTGDWQSADAIARAAGIQSKAGTITYHERRQVSTALKGRAGVATSDNGLTGSARRVFYRLASEHEQVPA